MFSWFFSSSYLLKLTMGFYSANCVVYNQLYMVSTCLVYATWVSNFNPGRGVGFCDYLSGNISSEAIRPSPLIRVIHREKWPAWGKCWLLEYKLIETCIKPENYKNYPFIYTLHLDNKSWLIYSRWRSKTFAALALKFVLWNMWFPGKLIWHLYIRKYNEGLLVYVFRRII